MTTLKCKHCENEMINYKESFIRFNKCQINSCEVCGKVNLIINHKAEILHNDKYDIDCKFRFNNTGLSPITLVWSGVDFVCLPTQRLDLPVEKGQTVFVKGRNENYRIEVSRIKTNYIEV